MSQRAQLAAACLIALGLTALPVEAKSPPAKAAASTTDAATAAKPDPALEQAVAGSWRAPANVARDMYRHPLQTLTFFGIKPDQTVVEIIPGNGFYAEILAPYLSKGGHYIAAMTDPAALADPKRREGATKSMAEFKAKLADKRNAGATVVGYDPKAPSFGAPGSADAVITFRNVHNWRMSGGADGMFKGFYSVLKPGGTLGVVEHRANADVAADDKSGYVSQAQVIALAQAAGFQLAAQSEINANPKDTKDYPGGVWTLPPSNSHDAEDDSKYKAIGESDRMTLRFTKPAK